MEPDDLPLQLEWPAAGSRRLLSGFHDQLRAAILDGRLRPGLRMPSTRALAAQYGISRNTALAAYDMLLAEGYLLARPRGGTFVAATLPQPQVARARSVAPALNAWWSRPPLPTPHGQSAATLSCDFLLGSPATDELRWDIWQRLTTRAIRMLAKERAVYADPHGLPRLRAAIAGHVSFARAVGCDAEGIVVTSGTQQALDLLARILVTPGKTVVAVEDPGYVPARAAFGAAGARVVPVPVDGEGLIVERLPAHAKVVYVTPSHQFPTGVVMSMARRAALIAWAERHGAVILEDDYDGEFRFDARPLDALQTLDRGASVFYLGTFSKSLFPGLRLGFVAAPAWARAALVAAKQAADAHGPLIEQHALAAFIEEGHLARHVRRMRRVYGERRTALLGGLARHCGEWLDPVPNSAGLHLTAYARRGLKLQDLMGRAAAQGVGVYALAPYYAGRVSRDGLVFGYGTTTTDAIARGLRLLGKLPT
ncbi:PLP-dependent aminotransferase family protein [Massilia arenosa]|uniref:PLP-dependent aminotransferase family protein n=1 Tax=Zemynaea arenosa TaxID=2561931 RepID=A0A4Y9SD04_9BURK|nr:PLP-dependent aminotransferase family protein [Massilia arenosa]